MKEKVRMFKRYLAIEVGIEFKACLYFFCILFFYSVFQILNGSWQVGILHMAEMILTTYFMGYLQLFLFSNFDEGERFGVKEFLYSLICSLIYTGVAYLGNWYFNERVVYVLFFGFMELAYLCAFLVYKIKRENDTRMLNKDLRVFQERGDKAFEWR